MTVNNRIPTVNRNMSDSNGVLTSAPDFKTPGSDQFNRKKIVPFCYLTNSNQQIPKTTILRPNQAKDNVFRHLRNKEKN